MDGWDGGRAKSRVVQILVETFKQDVDPFRVSIAASM